MIRIDVKDLDLENNELDDKDVCIITVNGEDKYYLTPINYYDDMQDMKLSPSNVKIIGPEDVEINEKEYEQIKKQLIEALDNAIKPSIKKLS